MRTIDLPDMRIYINGQSTDFPGTSASLIDLISFLQLTKERLAIELNETVISRKNWESTELKPDDRVEIVHFVGGG